MHRSQREIHEATDRFERYFDELDPGSVEVDHTSDLAAIAEATDAVAVAQERVRERVEVARAHGRSWNRIALALGVSRQAARERFKPKTRG